MLTVVSKQRINWRESISDELALPLYQDDVTNFIRDFYEQCSIMPDYLDQYNKIKNKPLEELTKNEIVAYLTYIIRGERFYDGHMATYIEDGTLEKLITLYNGCVV